MNPDRNPRLWALRQGRDRGLTVHGRRGLRPSRTPWQGAAIFFVIFIACCHGETTDPAATVCPAFAVEELKIVNDRWPDATSEHTFAKDVIRISGAKTDQEKALALWQWLRRCTMKLKGRGGHIETVKLLNFLGAEHCDGMSLAMQHFWRALGYPARKYYRNGHTYADCWWVDADGVGRWHVFDTNYGWFLFTRDGSRIATGDEIATDFSLFDHPSRTTVPWIDKHYWMWAWTHARMYDFSLRDVRVVLQPGTQFERLWDNIGRPYSDKCTVRKWHDPDPRPYPWTYGNGTLRLTADFGPHWREQLAMAPVNVKVVENRLVQDDPGRPGEVAYAVRTPYPIADVDVRLTPANGAVTVSAGRLDGSSWRTITTIPARKPAERTITYKRSGFRAFEPPMGRRAHLVRLRLEDGASIEKLRIDTVVHYNFLSLPTLLPGDNRITLSGKLKPGFAIEVAYAWDDPTGTNKSQVVRAARLPYTYTIRSAGRRWRDVRCRSLTVRTVRTNATRNLVLAAPPSPPAEAVGNVKWTDVLTLNGPKAAPALKTTAEYLRDLQGEDRTARRLALSGLIVRRDPVAWDVLVRIAMEDTSTHRYYAIQALHWTDSKRAWPVMARLLKKAAGTKWPETQLKVSSFRLQLAPEDATYDNCAGLIAALCAQGGNRDAVPLLCETLDRVQHTDAKWAILRALGKLGDPRARETVRSYTKQGGSDTSTVAILAAARLGDREIVPLLKEVIRAGDRRGYDIRQLQAIKAAGMLRAEGMTDLLLPFLEHKTNEMIRAAAAEALSRIGDPGKAIPAIEAALKAETFGWPRSKMREALTTLRGRRAAEQGRNGSPRAEMRLGWTHQAGRALTLRALSGRLV